MFGVDADWVKRIVLSGDASYIEMFVPVVVNGKAQRALDAHGGLKTQIIKLERDLSE